MATRKKAKKTSAKKAAKRPVTAKKPKAAAKPAPRKKLAAKRVASKKPAPKRAAPKKAAAKKAAPRKAPPRKAPPKKAAARKTTIRREDHAGHLDPKYAAELRRQGSHPDAEPEGFIHGSRSKDTQVEELGEEFVQQATSGEYEAEDRENETVTEERGGPFVPTSGGTEFAEGTDPSNPDTATREPFPTT
jgi:hypothetical protein